MFQRFVREVIGPIENVSSCEEGNYVGRDFAEEVDRR